MNDEIDRQFSCWREDDFVGNLRNLLAVIHRDGGHHTARVGLKQSCEDAHNKIIKLLATEHGQEEFAPVRKKGETHWSLY